MKQHRAFDGVLGRVLLAALVLVASAAIAAAQPNPIVVTVVNTTGSTRTFGTTLTVRATVASVNAIDTVAASVGGVSAALTFTGGPGGFWEATLQTAALPRGPVVLVVTATDTLGHTAQDTLSLTHDNPPVLEYLSPDWNALARPDIRVRARCTDDGGSCQVRAAIGEQSISGMGEIDGVISLAALEGRVVNFTIAAVDSAFQVTSTWRPVFVESSQRLAPGAPWPGLILDIDEDRALILTEAVPRTVLLVNRSNAQTQTLFTENAATASQGWLTPAGALLLTTASGPLPWRLLEWRNGALADLGPLASPLSVRVAGDWAIYSIIDGPCCVNQPLIRRNLLDGTTLTVSPTALNEGNDVAANGVVFYAEPAGSGYDLYRYSNGLVSPIVAGTASREIYPETDGTIAAFTSADGDPSPGQSFGIGLFTGSAVEMLATGFTSQPTNAYLVANGWTAFLKPGPDGSVQVWTRAPDGGLRQVTATGVVAALDALSAAGDVVYRAPTPNGVRRFLARADGSTPTVVGSMLGRPVWLGDQLAIVAGPHLLTAAPSAAAESIFAEGATGPFFDTEIAILNPVPAAAPVLLTYIRDDGTTIDADKAIGPNSRLTFRVDDEAGMSVTSFATRWLVNPDAPVVLERTMTWDDRGYGGHSGSAIAGPRMKWLFAEGAQGYFDTYVLLVNTRPTAASARLTFLVEGGSPVVRTVPLPGNARVTVHAAAIPELVDHAFSIIVDATAPIVAERAMYFGAGWIGGHESAGVPEAARKWYHAEGATGPVFDTYLLLANPNDQDTTVVLWFLTDAGLGIPKIVTLPALSRMTIAPKSVAPELAAASFATTVDADRPIVSERSMYWSTTGGAWQEAHNSFGVTTPALRWATADGRAGGPRRYQTYVLVGNPSTTEAATLTVTFYLGEGVTVTRTRRVEANSRLTIACNEVPELADQQFGVVVESTNGVPVMVERATYWDAGGVTWAAGTNVTATPIP